MKRFLLLTIATLATSGIALAQEQPDQARLKGDNPPLTEEQRAQADQRLNDTWTVLPVESKMRLMRLHRALSEMPPDERRFIHDRVERFLNMTPEEREELAKNRRKWEQMTPEERQKAREAFRKRRQEFEEKWRQEHPGEKPPPFLHKPKGPRPPRSGDREGAPVPPPPAPSDQ